MFAAIVRVLGDYATFADAAAILLARNRGGGANEDIADLHGRRLVILPELPKGRMNTNQVKKLTGGDPITARFLFGHLFVFAPTHTFIVYTNELPEVPESGVAIWDRIRVIPLNHRFGDDQLPRAEVEQCLAAEAEGLLAWCVQGAIDYHQDGLGDEPDSVRGRTRQYQQDEDIVRQFLDDRAILDPEAWTSSAELYKAYREWSELEGGGRPESQRWLGDRLVEHGLELERVGHARTRGFNGVRLEGTLA